MPTSDEIILKRKQNTSKKKMCLSATDPIVRTATNSSVHFIAKSEAKDHLVDNLNRVPRKKRHLRRLVVACFRRFKSRTCKFVFFYWCSFETFVTIFFMLCWLLTLRWIKVVFIFIKSHFSKSLLPFLFRKGKRYPSFDSESVIQKWYISYAVTSS